MKTLNLNTEILDNTINYVSLYEYKLVRSKTNITLNNINDINIVNDDIAADIARELYDNSIVICESFFVLYLNNNNNIIGYTKISQGGLDQTIVEPILIAKYAIDSLSKKIILVHNHPSGNLKPSDKDIKLTKQIIKMLSLFNIKVLDHIIVTEKKHLSFSNENIIDFDN